MQWVKITHKTGEYLPQKLLGKNRSYTLLVWELKRPSLPIRRTPESWCRGTELNRRRAALQAAALPPELPRRDRQLLDH